LANQKLSHLYTFKSGIKIGVIGLSTIYSAHTSTGFTSGKFPAYKFLEYKDIIINESKHLKKSGANAVLVLGHLGNNCNTTNTNGNWTVDTKQDECTNDEASNLIESLPNGTIDGLLQGHRHKFAHHFKNGRNCNI
jgi:2',3'-cyclic-nucleotide 2'-phosphodiesterase (5'-nucleotidase family)